MGLGLRGDDDDRHPLQSAKIGSAQIGSSTKRGWQVSLAVLQLLAIGWAVVIASSGGVAGTNCL